MKPYCKNEKPFVYTVFSDHDGDKALSVLQKISEDGINFWFSPQFSKREIKRIEAAFSCIIFISNDSMHDENVRECIENAVKYNKKILCVYLEPTPLDLGLELLLNSLQSIDRDGYTDEEAFLEKLKSSEVFSDMKITGAQKRFAKHRALASVFVPVASAAVIFLAVVVPLLIAPMVLAANGSLSKVGFGNLSLAELAKVEELNVVGNQSFDPWCYSHYTDPDTKKEVYVNEIQETVPTGDISDISDLALLKNAKVMTFSANQVSDISPLYKIKTLEWLAINCNPIKSIEGIEALQNLKAISIAETEISDISPLYKIPSLEFISIENTYVDSIEGIEELPHLLGINIGNSNLTDISAFNKIDFSYVNDTEGFRLGADFSMIQDFSPLQNIPKFYQVIITVNDADDILPYLSNKEVYDLQIGGSDINSIQSLSSLGNMHILHLVGSYDLTSLEGIEKHTGLIESDFIDCPNITDFSPLLELPNLERLIVSADMKDMIEAQLDGADFEIIYGD